MKILLVVLVLCYFVSIAYGQTSPSSNTSSFPELDPDFSYCFEFTWFGPDFDNATRYNGTCSDYLDETRAEGIPCASPIVISYDGTPPDMNYLWKNHKPSILCRRSRNQVCAKYTFFFNNQVNNVTHMCARAISVDSNSGVSDGCYRQSSGAYETEVCICRSGPGLYQPCNDANASKLSLSLLFFFALYQICRYIV